MSNHRGLLIVLGVLVVIFLLGPLLGGGMMGQGMMWSHDPQGILGISGWAWGLMMALGLLSMFAFWGALIVGIVLLVRWLGRTMPRMVQKRIRHSRLCGDATQPARSRTKSTSGCAKLWSGSRA